MLWSPMVSAIIKQRKCETAAALDLTLQRMSIATCYIAHVKYIPSFKCILSYSKQKIIIILPFLNDHFCGQIKDMMLADL